MPDHLTKAGVKLAGQNCPHTRLQKNVEIAYKSKVHITRSDTTTITRDSVVCCARQGLHKPSTQNPCKACMLPCKTLAGALSSRTQRGCVYALHSVKCGFYFEASMFLPAPSSMHVLAVGNNSNWYQEAHKHSTPPPPKSPLH